MHYLTSRCYCCCCCSADPSTSCIGSRLSARQVWDGKKIVLACSCRSRKSSFFYHSLHPFFDSMICIKEYLSPFPTAILACFDLDQRVLFCIWRRYQGFLSAQR